MLIFNVVEVVEILNMLIFKILNKVIYFLVKVLILYMIFLNVLVFFWFFFNKVVLEKLNFN